MPIYEYECDDCKEWTEVMCSTEEMPKSTTCGGCANTAYRRIKTVPGLSIPVKHQAVGSTSKKHGIKNPITGEGVKKNGKYR